MPNVKEQFDDLVEALKLINPVLQRRLLLGIDTKTFDQRPALVRIDDSFQELLKKPNYPDAVKQTYTNLFMCSAKMLLALLPEKEERRNAVCILIEMNTLQQKIMSQNMNAIDIGEEMNIPLRARL
jgi:hypothetical protein